MIHLFMVSGESFRIRIPVGGNLLEDDGEGNVTFSTDGTEVTVTITTPAAYAGTYGPILVADVVSAPVNLLPPPISGTPTDGATLTASPGLWLVDASRTFNRSRVWAADGAELNETTLLYEVDTSIDGGKELTHREYGQYDSEATVFAESEAIVVSSTQPSVQTQPQWVLDTQTSSTQVWNLTRATFTGNYSSVTLLVELDGVDITSDNEGTSADPVFTISRIGSAQTLLVTETAIAENQDDDVDVEASASTTVPSTSATMEISSESNSLTGVTPIELVTGSVDSGENGLEGIDA